MIIEGFSAKWFIIYYTILGFLLIFAGLYLILKRQQGKRFLIQSANREAPPRLFIIVLKYFLLFTLPGLVLSFIPFSWVELLFSFWSLVLVYLAGIQLVRWEQTRVFIKANKAAVDGFIKRSGAIMVAVGFIILLLSYLVIKRAV